MSSNQEDLEVIRKFEKFLTDSGVSEFQAEIVVPLVVDNAISEMKTTLCSYRDLMVNLGYSDENLRELNKLIWQLDQIQDGMGDQR